ncbi:uncharacterized protein [Lolium perenne]|uniref:uncharacterized protein isoform X2 n=1 Tax=Lolium perenne TaxID=4522 RepID=UPI003A99F739
MARIVAAPPWSKLAFFMSSICGERRWPMRRGGEGPSRAGGARSGEARSAAAVLDSCISAGSSSRWLGEAGRLRGRLQDGSYSTRVAGGRCLRLGAPGRRQLQLLRPARRRLPPPRPITENVYKELEPSTKKLRFSLPYLLLAFPVYLWYRSPGKNSSQFNPSSDLFTPNERRDVIILTTCWFTVIALLIAMVYVFGPMPVLKLYGVPYAVFVIWLDLVTRASLGIAARQ